MTKEEAWKAIEDAIDELKEEGCDITLIIDKPREKHSHGFLKALLCMGGAVVIYNVIHKTIDSVNGHEPFKIKETEVEYVDPEEVERDDI